MGCMIDACIVSTGVKFAGEVLCSTSVPVLAMKFSSWRCLTIQLDEIGSSTVSLTSLVCFVLVCEVSSRHKATCMEIRNMHILMCAIHFQSLLSVAYL